LYYKPAFPWTFKLRIQKKKKKTRKSKNIVCTKASFEVLEFYLLLDCELFAAAQ
jgi:hypothetical protein